MNEGFRHPLPGELVTHVTAICGRRGQEWLQRLPETIGALEEQWSIGVGEPFPGGEFNFVAAGSRTDGERVVVKIAPPYERPEIHCEAAYLSVRDGSSAVSLIAYDADRDAILLEHALPGKALFEHFRDEPLACGDAAIGVAKAILRPPPVDTISVQKLDDWFGRFRLRYRDTDFDHELAEKAIAIYDGLSKEPGRTFYLHGDFHPGNIVTATREPFLAIDPKGLVGHIGYDIAVFMNNLHWWQKGKAGVEQLLDDGVVRFAAAFDMTETEVRQWSYAYMVIGAWWNFDEMRDLYEDQLAIADVWGI